MGRRYHRGVLVTAADNPHFSLPRAVESDLRSPAVIMQKIGPESVATVAERQVRIALEPSTGGGLRLIPQTRAAVELLGDASRGPRVRQLVDGYLQSFHERGLAPKVAGISFADSPEGFVANVALSELHDRARVAREGAAQIVTRAISDWTGKSVGAGFHNGSAWIDVGASTSKVLGGHIAGEPLSADFSQRLAHVLVHEGNHGVTTPSADAYAALPWLEEGVTEVLTRMPGVVARSAELMGFPTASGVSPVVYAGPAQVVEGLLELAGVQPHVSEPGAARGAVALLADLPLEDLPRELAVRILATQPGAMSEAELTTQIEQLDGDPARWSALRSELASR